MNIHKINSENLNKNKPVQKYEGKRTINRSNKYTKIEKRNID